MDQEERNKVLLDATTDLLVDIFSSTVIKLIYDSPPKEEKKKEKEKVK